MAGEKEIAYAARSYGKVAVRRVSLLVRRGHSFEQIDDSLPGFQGAVRVITSY